MVGGYIVSKRGKDAKQLRREAISPSGRKLTQMDQPERRETVTIP